MLTGSDAVALLDYGKKKYGDDWFLSEESRALHKQLVQGCSSLWEAKEKLDLNAPTMGFKSSPGFAPPGFKPEFASTGLRSSDAVALLDYGKKKYGDDWFLSEESRALHKELIQGCSSLCEAKEKLDLNAPTMGFKTNPGFAPPGFKPVFVGAISSPEPILSTTAPSWSSIAATDASGFSASNSSKPKKPSTRKTILEHLPQLMIRAQRLITQISTLYPSAQATVCFMWDSGGQERHATSGGGKFQSLTQGKETVCAEDVLLQKFSQITFKYSLSYDKQNGWKPACQKGCHSQLQDRSIEDLYWAAKDHV